MGIVFVFHMVTRPKQRTKGQAQEWKHPYRNNLFQEEHLDVISNFHAAIKQQQLFAQSTRTTFHFDQSTHFGGQRQIKLQQHTGNLKVGTDNANNY